MDRDGQDRTASTGAQRVRDWRARRRAAGLVEVKAWVRAADVGRAQQVLQPLTDEANRVLARHARQGRSNQVAVMVRFPRTPPGAFRAAVLQRGWGLAWDGAQGCWHGLVEDAARVAVLGQMVAPHGGRVEAGPGADDQGHAAQRRGRRA
ncbi:MAG: hypothetical protein JOZ32_06055 [Bryobacterales bacterium]|nr:hypothetical protein [Bryobacterales bacterium]